MEFVSFTVDKLLEYTVIPVLRQVGYAIFYKTNVAELKKQAKQLLLERESVQHRVDEARRNVDKIEGVVLKWQSDVDEIASKAKNLLDEDDKRHKRTVEETEGGVLKWPSDIACKAKDVLHEENERCKNIGCSSKSFSKLCLRYQLSRKAKKLSQEIMDIKSKKNFDKVSYREELKLIGIGSSSTTSGEAFESRVVVLNQIMEALADPNLNMIGVYGLGGVGKTTLVHEVAKKAKEKSSDLKVVFVIVKQKPEIKELQQQIAEMLQLRLEENTCEVRATLLRKRIDEEKTILMILDDLWEKLDLVKIGLNYERENKNFKVLMTSRSIDVLFNHMNTQKNFQLTELTKGEAWKLFKEKSSLNESSESEELLSVARDVTAECGGLPIAIVTVAAALKGKKIVEWRDVRRRLRNHLYSDINRPVEVSYENLEDDCLKSLFILAGVITSPFTMDLFKYSCGLGLFHDMTKMAEMQDCFETFITKLKDSCLLQDSYCSNRFIMHDVVQDAAISIARKDRQFFLKRNDKLGEEEWLKDANLKNCKAIFLDFCHIEKIPTRLDCPKLIFFHLLNNDPCLKLPDNFFKGMPALKVLVLINMYFEFLPSSICLLSDLHTLCLDECVLKNIEGIGKLKGLKILSLSGSEITDLPQEIGQLTKLQLFDLSGCSKLESIPPNVISNLKMLEMLLMVNSFDKWAVGDQQSTASVAEIKDLSHLNTLAVCVPDENMLPKEHIFESLPLQTYQVSIGDSGFMFRESKSSRSLCLDLLTAIDSKHYFESILDCVEDLYVRRLKGAKNVVPNINENVLLELKHLEVYENDELQFIVDLVGHRDFFPNLESLFVCQSDLVKLCNGYLTEGSFSKLRVIRLYSCPKMKSIFTFSLPISLPQLNEIKVDRCYLLEGIVSDDGKVVGVYQFPEVRTLELIKLPALTGFYSEDKTHQKQTQLANDNKSLDPRIALFSQKASFPNLETLHIMYANKLNKIWDWQVQQFNESSFGNLKTLEVSDCDGISKLLPFNVLEFLPNLEELKVDRCASIEVIFDLEGTTKEEAHDIVMSSHLRKLTLYHLPKLKHVWNNDLQGILDFQCLSVVHISYCQKLKYVFPVSVIKVLVKLQELSITSCPELENIVGRQEGIGVSISFVFPQITKMKLGSLPKFARFYPETYSTEWPLLQELYYEYANEDCNIFGSGLIGFEESHCWDGQLPYPIEKSLPNLRELTLNCNESTMAWLERYSPNDFSLRKLEILKLEFFDNVPSTFPSSFVQKMYALKTLEVKYGSFEEIFPLKRVSSRKTQCDSGIHIKALTLQALPRLKHICKERDGLDPILENLEKLDVFGCSSMSNLVPPSVKFNHLTSLEVNYCDMILHLMASSTANSLCQLTNLRVSGCKNIKEIVADKVTEITYEITFRKLKTLELDDLSQLKSFCSMNYIFNFPSLENVNIERCPKLEIFSKRTPNTPKLESIEHVERGSEDSSSESDSNSPKLQNIEDDSSSEDNYWEGDLNSTIKKLYTYKLLYRRKHLNLSEYPYLKQIWHSQLPSGAFHNLTRLTLSNCEWFPKGLPLNVLKCLINLKYLQVKSCDSVEILFDLEEATNEERDNILTMNLRLLHLTFLPNLKQVWNKYPQGILNFPKLTVMEVMHVPKLEHLSIEKAFPNLAELYVDKEAIKAWLGQFQANHFNKLEQIILRFFEDASTIYGLEEIFPLEEQAVKECSSLLDLAPSPISFNLLKTLEVTKCDQLLYLMSASTANYLGHLEILMIEGCRMIKEIMLDKMVDAEKIEEIAFNKLEVLMLENLTSLETFCSTNYVFNFPLLRYLRILQCPNLKIFSKHAPSTPSLGRVYDMHNSYWEDDLNSTVQKLYRDQSMEKTTNASHQKGEGQKSSEGQRPKVNIPSEISIEETSALDYNIEEPVSELVLMGPHEGNEQNQVNIDSDQEPRKVGMNEYSLYNLNTGAGSSGDLPTDLKLKNKTKQWDNFDSGVGPSCSLEVKGKEVVQSTQDCQSVKERVEETAQKDPTLEKLELAISPLEINRKAWNNELVLIDQQHALGASRKLQPLATNSHLTPISGFSEASNQSFSSIAEASGSFVLPSITDAATTSSPPSTSNAAIPSLLEDLLSRLHLLLSSEAMSYLRDGFSRYPWALHLLESWSDKSWNWSYFVIFARVLCILQTTTAANLSEALFAELISSLNTLGNVGFDVYWIAAVYARIHDRQVHLTNLHEAKALLWNTKNVIAGRLIEFESLVDSMRNMLTQIDASLAECVHREELAHNVIGLP